MQIKDLITVLRELRFEPEKDNCEKRDIQTYLKNYQLLPSQFFYVVDVPSGKITWHKGFETFLGYSGKDVSIGLIQDMYHPDEKAIMWQIVERAFRFAATQVKANPFEIKFMISYRIRKADGTYIKVLRQSTAIEVDANGKLISTISICTDISDIKKDNKIEWSYTGPGETEFDISDILSGTSGDRIKARISKRETDILRYLALGKTSEEISGILHISYNTVNTHRRNMLKKTGLKNTTELVLMGINEGIVD